jgi:hypothetical protein
LAFVEQNVVILLDVLNNLFFSDYSGSRALGAVINLLGLSSQKYVKFFKINSPTRKDLFWCILGLRRFKEIPLIQQSSWFHPGLSFRGYLNKYPFVFLFSFLCAFCWVAQWGTVWFFDGTMTLNRIAGYSPWVYSFFLGVTFFAFLHLVLASPLLQNFKYHVVVYVLGLASLYGFYNYLLEHDMTWSYFAHWFDMAGLAAFLWPLAGWKLTKEASHSYIWNFLRSLIKAYIVYLIVASLFIFIPMIAGGPITNFIYDYLHWRLQFQAQINLFTGPASQTASFLIFPWYLLGGLEQTVNPSEKTGEGSAVPGPRAVLWFSLVTLVFYLFESYKLFLQWRSHQNNYFMDEKLIPLLSTIYCIGLVLNQKGNAWEKWGTLFVKFASAFTIVFIALSEAVKNHNNFYGGWSEADVYSFMTMLWFIGVFAYFFFRKDPGWVKPVLCLWVLMAIALVGPLNPSNLSRWDHETILKKKMTEAGLLKNGLLVKPAAKMEPAAFLPIQNCLYWFDQNEGLNWFRSSFPQELRDLNWGKEKIPANLNLLLEWLGKEKQPNPAGKPYFSNSGNFSIGPLPNRMQLVGDYELQTFYMPQRLQPHRENGYCLDLPMLSETLTVFFNNQLLGKISIKGLARKLAKYDTTDEMRQKVKSKDMMLVYENDKLKIKLYFSNIRTFKAQGELKIISGNGVLMAKRK